MPETMRLYLVVSEQLEDVVCEDASVGACHVEPYCICELVVARNRAQATYLAWQHDRPPSQNVGDKPKFRTETKVRNVEGPARIASGEKWIIDADWCWKDEPDLPPEEA